MEWKECEERKSAQVSVVIYHLKHSLTILEVVEERRGCLALMSQYSYVRY